MCVFFAVAVCNQFALFSLSCTTDECANSMALADWQFRESQDHVSSVMSHVAPVQANQNPINAKLSVCLVVKASSVSSHVTHSRVFYSSSSADLLSTSAPTIERQDIMDPP